MLLSKTWDSTVITAQLPTTDTYYTSSKFFWLIWSQFLFLHILTQVDSKKPNSPVLSVAFDLYE